MFKKSSVYETIWEDAFRSTPVQVPLKTIEAGTYTVDSVPHIGYYLERDEPETDKLIYTKDKNVDKIVNEFETFWRKRSVYNKFNIMHKRGIILEGTPGTGKTTLINLISKKVVEDFDGIVINAYEVDDMTGGVDVIRRVEKNRPVLVIFEDIDQLITEGMVSIQSLLNVLDGQNSLNGVMVVATTNYVGKLDKRLTERPSRFDSIITIGAISAEARRHFLVERFGKALTSEEVDKFVEASEGMPISHLKELVVGVKCLDQPFKEVVDKVKGMMSTEE
jgi:SpoVK/Ycf46/Vps4 family AAA+-type ATPase